MKKFYKIKTLTAIAFAFFANMALGQILVISSNGNPVSNDDVIELPYEFQDLSLPDYDYYEYKYTWDPHIYVSVSDGEEALTITVSSAENNDGFEICWPTVCAIRKQGEPVSVTGNVTTTPEYVSLHKSDSFYSVDERPTEAPEIKINFKTDTEDINVLVKCLLSGENAVNEISDINVVPVYYTIQGVRVAEPQKGQLYIERKGGKVTKKIF